MELNWRILAPLIIIQVILWIIAFVDLARRDDSEIRFGKKWPWVLIVLLISAGIGPILYLVAGRKNA